MTSQRSFRCELAMTSVHLSSVLGRKFAESTTVWKLGMYTKTKSRFTMPKSVVHKCNSDTYWFDTFQTLVAKNINNNSNMEQPSEQSRSVQFVVDVETTTTTTTTKTRDGDAAAGSSELEKSITIHDFDDDEAIPSETAHTMLSADSRNESSRRRRRSFRDSLRSIGSSNSLRRLSKSASMMSVSVLEPPTGLSTFTSSSIVVNYISAGYVLLPWGKPTNNKNGIATVLFFLLLLE